MPSRRIIGFTPEAWAKFKRKITKVDKITGVGVVNAPDGVAVLQQSPRRPPPRTSASLPRLARITAIHDNYVEANLMGINPSTGTATVISDPLSVNVAMHPYMQRQFYDGKTLPDPISATNVTFTYNSPNSREADNGTTTEAQRPVPWYTTHVNDAPIVVERMDFTVPSDGGGTVVYCTYVEASPRYWAKA